MNMVKLYFTIPEETVIKLRAVVSRRHRSAFVAEAISDKLKQLEQEQLRRALIGGYSARREEDTAINEEWERATLEGWG